MHFRLKSLFAFQAGAVALLALVLWLRTDTIFYCNGSCELHMPDGTILNSNRWFKSSGNEGFGLLGTTRKDEWHLIQHTDSSKIAMLKMNGVFHEVVVTRTTTRGPKHRAEFWIRPGNRVQTKE